MTASSARPAGNVIVLGVDTPIGVAILRDLGSHGYEVIGVGRAETSIGFASRHCHHCVVRAATEPELVAQLQSLAREFAPATLLAISEHDHLLINRHRSELEPLLAIPGVGSDLLEQVLDKAHCNRVAQRVGIRVPDTFTPTGMEEVRATASGLSYPRVIKWADPNTVAKRLGAHGLALHKYQYAHDAKELIALLRPYEAIGVFPLVQEYCPGGGIGQMFLVHSGEIVLEFQHERIHEWPPEGGVSSLCRAVPLDAHRECREKSIALLRELRWQGIAMVEYRYDRGRGEYYFMEINGRFWGSLPLATEAGLPFASRLVQMASGGEVDRYQPDYPELMCRFMIPEARRLVRLLFQSRQIQDPFFRYSPLREFVGFFANFLRPKVRYYIFNRDDPGPFFADLKNIAARAAFWRN